jgi:hypothetical protein
MQATSSNYFLPALIVDLVAITWSVDDVQPEFDTVFHDHWRVRVRSSDWLMTSESRSGITM